MNTANGPASTDPSETTLVSGEVVALRRWERETPGDWKPDVSRPYEVVGFVVSGQAELRVNGEVRSLGPSDTYVVPAEAQHSYRILEEFTSFEAVSPPPAP